MVVESILLMAALAGRPQFPVEPIREHLVQGRLLGRSKPKISSRDLFHSPAPRTSFDSIWKSDMQNIGWWSNGYSKQPVEQVIWLSPELMSRWLGFLQAREYWSDDELLERWGAVRERLTGSYTFIVQLAAFPKLPTYGIGDYVRSTPEELLNVRFVMTSRATSLPLQARQLAFWQARKRDELKRFDWWRTFEFGWALTGEFDLPSEPPFLAVGDYYRAWYLVSIDTAPKFDRFEVRTLSRRKERVASFEFPIASSSGGTSEGSRKPREHRSSGFSFPPPSFLGRS